jgi:serine protease inhibitor
LDVAGPLKLLPKEMRMRRSHCKQHGVIGLVAALALALAGCGGDPGPAAISSQIMRGVSAAPAVLQARSENAPVDPAIVAADNGFGLKMLNTLITESPGNVAISSLSLSLALQILYNGAGGTTQQAMQATLDLGPLDTQQLNQDNAALQAALMGADPEVQLTVANSLWVDLAAYPVQAAFIGMDEDYYGATVGNLAGAPANVNAWVDSQTQGLIPQILPPDLPSSAFRIAILANAVYFKGIWTTSFNPAQTLASPFTLTGGSQVSVPMMWQTGPFDYFQGAQGGRTFQAIRIPYGQGRMSMLIALPAAGTNVASFAASIDAATLTGWKAQFRSTTVTLGLPRFTASYQASLAGALTSLGMGMAFGTGADFSGIASGATVSDVFHAAKIEVDETGTVAAGATAISITTSVVQATPPMVMDHPFFYAIQDDGTGELLFVGVMLNPAQT